MATRSSGLPTTGAGLQHFVMSTECSASRRAAATCDRAFRFPGQQAAQRLCMYGAGRVYLFEESKVYSLDVLVLVAHR